MKITAIVPAAGSGKRLKENKNKPFVKLKSKPLLVYALKTLNRFPLIDEIILVVAKKNIWKAENLIKEFSLNKVKSIISGGKTRAQSVWNGLKAVGNDTDYILIHDGVRPFLDNPLIEKGIKAVKKYGASCVCVPIKPTIKKVKRNYILSTPNRKMLFETQTPQIFRRDIILKAYKNQRRLKTATDDSSLVEQLGYRVRIVKGTERNIKITTKEDLLLAEALLR